MVSIICLGTVVICCGCELIILEQRNQTNVVFLPDLDQASAEGVVHLFKTELDSNNVFAALHVLCNDDRPLLAVEKYEMQEEIARVGRLMGGKKITKMRIDTLSQTKHFVRMECNYTKEFGFTTIKLDDGWYIAAIRD